MACVSGAIGFFVVTRGASFSAHAIPNGAFAGAAGANLLGIDPIFGLVSLSLLAAFIIGASSQRRNEIVTALSLVFMLSLGAAFLSQSTSYSSLVGTLLFGQILGVGSSSVFSVSLIGVGSLALLALIYRPLLLSSVSSELAEAHGVPVKMINIVFFIVVALATALTVPIVGALLSYSLMIGPPAAARLISTRPQRAFLSAVALAVGTMWISIVCSYEINWPVGFFVGTLSAAVYLIARASRVIGRSRLGAFV